MSDILVLLKDLHKQATVERSHYYTGKVIRLAIVEIATLRSKLDAMTHEAEQQLLVRVGCAANERTVLTPCKRRRRT